MKRILNLPTFILVAISAMFLYSCSDDPVDPTGNVAPVVTLTSDADITVDPAEVFTVTFTASKGSDSQLKAVTVYEAGTAVPNSRLTVNGVSAVANPLSIEGAEKDGISWTFDIEAHSIAATEVAFEVEVQDEAGERSSVFVNVTTAGTPPTLTAIPPNNTALELVEGTKNAFRLTGEKGTGDLVTLEVKENGDKIDPSRLTWNGESMVGMDNPFALGDTEKGGFEDTRLEIQLPMMIGEFTYSIILTDEFALTSTLTYTVTTTRSALLMREGVLLNSAGPMGTGGLDLDNGMGVGSMDAEAEIKDNGIDSDLPDDQNWLRTISPANNASMKYLIAGQGGLPEGFTFASIELLQDLPGLFSNGVDLNNGASDVVQVEDVFIVERDGTYWLLEVVQITTDPSGNEDEYKFDIKY